MVLSSRGQTDVNGLAERLGVNASTAVRMVDKLVGAELVTRQENPDNPDNRREVVLALTRAGRRMVDAVTERPRAEIARIVTAVPVRRRGELVAALTAFAAAADEPRVQDGRTGVGW